MRKLAKWENFRKRNISQIE